MTTETNSIELATELTIAWLGNPNTRTSADDVPAFLQSITLQSRSWVVRLPSRSRLKVRQWSIRRQ
jgi:hypothetical protein